MTRASLIVAALVLNALSSGFLVASDQVPGAPQKKPVALINAVLHPVSGPVIEDGVLIFDQGVITAIGRKEKPPTGAKVIDLEGQHVYPGLFEAHSQLGLTEVSSIRASIDSGETGTLNPNVQAHVSINPDSELIPVTRASGVLLALTAPTSGIISGRGAVVQLDGWTWEDLTLRPDAVMMVNWPRLTPSSFRGFGRSRAEQEDSASSGVESLRKLCDEARAWQKARDASPEEQRYDIRLAAMADVLDGKIPMLVAAQRAMEIQSAVSFAAEQGVKMIILGGHDAPLCVDLLKQYDVPVIVSAVHRNPLRRHEDYDSAYALPARLHEAGIAFCISGSDRSESWNARNLGHHAATAAAYGLPADVALRSVTLSPAEILGVADRVGSLEKGKDATLFVSSGNPLDMEVEVTHAWIQGRQVDLSSRHTQLYDKYRQKYRQLKAKK